MVKTISDINDGEKVWYLTLILLLFVERVVFGILSSEEYNIVKWFMVGNILLSSLINMKFEIKRINHMLILFVIDSLLTLIILLTINVLEEYFFNFFVYLGAVSCSLIAFLPVSILIQIEKSEPLKTTSEAS